MCTGMILFNGFSQELVVQVGVNLRREDGFMSQHVLHGAQIGTAGNQMGGKRVAQRVGRYRFVDARTACLKPDDVENHDPRQGVPAFVQKQDFLGIPLGIPFVPLGQVGFDFSLSPLAEGDEAFLAALAFHLDDVFVHVDVCQLQVCQFRYAQAAGVEQLDDCTVPLSFFPFEGDGINHAVNFCHCQNVGQPPSEFGRFQQDGRVVLDLPFAHQKMEEGAEARNAPGLCPAVVANLVDEGNEFLQHLVGHSFRFVQSESDLDESG